MLMMGSVVPIAYIGTLVFILGLYMMNQNKKGKTTFKKPAWVVSAGLILFLILGMTFNNSTQTTDKIEDNSVASTTEKNEATKKVEDAEKAKKDEEKAKAEADEKEKARAEAKAEAERIEKEKVKAEAKAKVESERIEKEKQESAQKEKEEQASTLGLELVTVGRVVDGDTIETSDGRKVRLIGVNTPESTTRTEEYGKEASNYTKSKLEGKQVWLQKDVSNTDRYSRYLRIIWLEIQQMIWMKMRFEPKCSMQT